MKIKLCNPIQKDSIIIEKETIEECRDIVTKEMRSRGWKYDECYSERLED